MPPPSDNLNPTPSSSDPVPGLGTSELGCILFDRAVDGMALVDGSGLLDRVNPALTELAGRPADRLEGALLSDLLDEEGAQGERSERARILRGETDSFTREFWLCRGEKPPAWVRIRGTRISKDADTLVYQIQDLTAHQDALTRLERSHEVMLNAHKLEAVGRLAGGVAHEFNNLLTGVQGYVRLLMEDKPLGHPDRDALVKINRSVERAVGLVAQLLAFGKQEFSQPEILDLAELVQGSEDILRSLLGELVALDLDNLDPVRVKVDPRQFEQVLINLAMNARDAMPEGGMARLSLDRVRLSEPDGTSRVWGAVTFADTGSGIPENIRDKIFEPFFSTRADGSGLGLGLSAVHGIVEAHEGRVTVESEEDRGTTFRIYLPAADSVGARTNTPTGEAAGPARILVVDDDPSVREVAARILRRLGYEVEEAGGGAEALARLAQSPQPPDLLLSDVVMPGMNGRQLSEKVRDSYPDTRVLFMSAYTEDEVILQGVRVAEVNFLPKPFSLESLAQAVQDVLGREVASAG